MLYNKLEKYNKKYVSYIKVLNNMQQYTNITIILIDKE